MNSSAMGRSFVVSGEAEVGVDVVGVGLRGGADMQQDSCGAIFLAEWGRGYK
jgi:hypothetical protein